MATMGSILNFFNIFNKPDRAASMTVGYDDTYECDASSADVTPPTTPQPKAGTDYWQNCRAISADTKGICKIRYRNMRSEDVTEVLYLNAGILRPVRKVYTVYRYYTGTTNVTAEYYNSAGVSKRGVKLHR